MTNNCNNQREKDIQKISKDLQKSGLIETLEKKFKKLYAMVRTCNGSSALGFLFLVALCCTPGAYAQDTPIGAPWWPSPWGSDDERGAANRITSEKILEAMSLVRNGHVYSLGHPYRRGMPILGSRHFSLTTVGSPTGVAPGSNRLVYFDELVTGELGHVGTQFDGLGHVGVRVGDQDIFYNGFTRDQVATSRGLRRLGVENVGPIVSRGVLIDVARSKGAEQLEAGYAITPDDLANALREQKVSIRPGDVVLIRTGHDLLWNTPGDYIGRGEFAWPGIGMAAAQWLVERQIVMVGADTPGVEVAPDENPDRFEEVHQHLITRHGIYLFEGLSLEELAADEVWTFAFIFIPLEIVGASGSPGNPIAIR